MIYSFYVLMLESLGSRATVLDELEARGGYVPVLPPFCCIRWRNGYQFLTNTTLGVFQYVFLRLTTTAITLVTEYVGVYNDGVFSWGSAYAYISFVINASQFWALYCLAGFYVQLRDELKHAGLRPLGKFATVKARSSAVPALNEGSDVAADSRVASHHRARP